MFSATIIIGDESETRVTQSKGAGQKLASEYKKNEYFRSWRYSFSHVMGYNKKNN